MRGLPPVTIRTTERRFRSGPNLLSDLKVLAVDGLAPKWFSFSTTQDSMGNEWITVIYQRLGPTAYCVRGSYISVHFACPPLLQFALASCSTACKWPAPRCSSCKSSSDCA